MKLIAIAILLVGLVAGCAHQQSSPPSASPSERPDLRYSTPSACESAGRTWNHTAGVCM